MMCLVESVSIHCWEHSEGPQSKNTALLFWGFFWCSSHLFSNLIFFSFWKFYHRPHLTKVGRAAYLPSPASHLTSHSRPGSHSRNFLHSTGQAGEPLAAIPPADMCWNHPGAPGPLQQLWSFLTGWFPFFQWFSCNFGGMEERVEGMEIHIPWGTRRPGIFWNSDFYTAIVSHGSSFWIWFISTQLTESLLDALCTSGHIVSRDWGDRHSRKREQTSTSLVMQVLGWVGVMRCGHHTGGIGPWGGGRGW